LKPKGFDFNGPAPFIASGNGGTLRRPKAKPHVRSPKLDEPYTGFKPMVLPDIKPFVAPVGNDKQGGKGTHISSRSQLRRLEIDHQVRQCGELKSHEDYDNRPKGNRDRSKDLNVEWSEMD
jgi:hypothetical protein